MSVQRLRPEDFQFTPPTFDDATIAEIAAEHYGLTGTFEALGGERDQNTKITTASGEAFVLKIAGALEDPDVVDFQIKALTHLADGAHRVQTPTVIPTLTNSLMVSVGQETTHVVRLLSFLPGETFRSVNRVSRSTLFDIGGNQGRLCRALSGFTHPASSYFMAWNISNGLVTSDELWEFARDDVQARAEWTRGHLTASQWASHPGRRQVIHNDGHRGNLIRRPGTQEVSGVIDFGDMIHAPIVNDIAVSVSSFLRIGPTVESSALAIARGFHAEMPLQEAEIDNLYDAVLARAVLSALLFDFQIATCPAHEAEAVDERPRVLADLTAWIEQDRQRLTDQLHLALIEQRTTLDRASDPS